MMPAETYPQNTHTHTALQLQRQNIIMEEIALAKVLEG